MANPRANDAKSRFGRRPGVKVTKCEDREVQGYPSLRQLTLDGFCHHSHA